jgi:hypothetical protein
MTDAERQRWQRSIVVGITDQHDNVRAALHGMALMCFAGLPSGAMQDALFTASKSDIDALVSRTASTFAIGLYDLLASVA